MDSSSPFEPALRAFGAIPVDQLWLVLLAALFAVVAGNGVFALHYRRVGKPIWRSLWNPKDFPLLQFNRLEWLLLVTVTAVFFGLVFLALRAGLEA